MRCGARRRARIHLTAPLEAVRVFLVETGPYTVYYLRSPDPSAIHGHMLLSAEPVRAEPAGPAS